MTVGAAGALNVILHSILNPKEEVIVFKPFFPEYKFYIDNHDGITKYCDYEDNFEPSLDNFESLINANTRAIILNSPNNPTGITYSSETIINIVEIIKRSEKNLILKFTL